MPMIRTLSLPASLIFCCTALAQSDTAQALSSYPNKPVLRADLPKWDALIKASGAKIE